MALANKLLTPEEEKEISRVPSHEMVSQYVHKLMQLIFSRVPSHEVFCSFC